jgi:hypothetical protein
MSDAWRPVVSVLAALAATVWAVLLLSGAPPQYPPAAALLVGAVLVALVLRRVPPISGAVSRFSSCEDYRACVTLAVSLGGGAVVAFALVWILTKVTSYGSGISATGETINLSQTISLPLIVIAGVTLLLIVIALVAFSFSVLGLGSAQDALGLPDGSVRAIIALMLLVLFSIMSIFLYNSIASRQPQTLMHVTLAGIDDLRSRAVIIHQQKETSAVAQGAPPHGQAQPSAAPAAGAAAEPMFSVTFRELSGPADDIAKQLIVMLGTLVTAVASFYFGSASVASASAAALGQKPGGPLAKTIGPNPVTASGDPQALMIVGSDLGGVTELHLEKKGEPDINASSVKPADKSLTAQITISKDKTGTWDVVVDDGSHAVTIGKIEVVPSAATQPDDATKAKDEPPSENAGAGQQPADSKFIPAALVRPDAAIFGEAILASATVPSTINTAFLGHGIFLEYSPIITLRRYAGYKGADQTGATTVQLIERFIQAMRDMHVSSVWIQLFSASGELDPTGHGSTSELVAALGLANIACVGWGYCYNGNAATDAGLAKHLCGKYGINAFIADVEPGNPVHGQPDSWQPEAFKNLIAGLKGTFGKDNLGISTFGTLNGHEDAANIYRLAVNDVALFAPQIYWYQKPPIGYVQACIASFRQAGIGTPMVGTAQAYWEVGKSGGVTRTAMEAKVNEFVTGFADWGKLIGLNWYHGGNANTEVTGAMSDAMIKSIADNRLDQKAYASPTTADAAILSA